MNSIPVQFMVYVLGWGLWFVESCLAYLLEMVRKKVTEIQSAGNLDTVAIPDVPSYQEGNILAHYFKPGSWMVLKYIPGEGYLLADDQGEQPMVSQLEAELWYFRHLDHSRENRHSE